MWRILGQVFFSSVLRNIKCKISLTSNNYLKHIFLNIDLHYSITINYKVSHSSVERYWSNYRIPWINGKHTAIRKGTVFIIKLFVSYTYNDLYVYDQTKEIFKLMFCFVTNIFCSVDLILLQNSPQMSTWPKTPAPQIFLSGNTLLF